jgi:hypothetical protein
MRNDFGLASAFMRLWCPNPQCEMYGARMVVERVTLVVLFTDYRMVEGQPVWPSHWMNRKGELVLPDPGRVTGG